MTSAQLPVVGNNTGYQSKYKTTVSTHETPILRRRGSGVQVTVLFTTFPMSHLRKWLEAEVIVQLGGFRNGRRLSVRRYTLARLVVISTIRPRFILLLHFCTQTPEFTAVPKEEPSSLLPNIVTAMGETSTTLLRLPHYCNGGPETGCGSR